MEGIEYYFSAILAVVTAGIFFWFRAKKSFESQLSLCLENIKIPIDYLAPFHKLSIRSTDQDRLTYLESYASLYTQADTLLKDFRINATKRDTKPLKQFQYEYSHIREILALDNELYDAKQLVESTIEKANHEYTLMFNGSNYLAESVKVEYYRRYIDLYSTLKGLINQLIPFLSDTHVQYCLEFIRTLPRLDDDKKDYNARYVADEKEKHKEYFDKVLTYPLSEQQRDAIIRAEDNCLVISAAGSGKTSTMEGKIKYLVEKKGIDPARLLIITYTRKAANSLTLRLNLPKLRCETFHKFSIDLIGQITGIKPTIYDEDKTQKTIYQRMLHQHDFLAAVNTYLFEYLNPTLKEFDFEDNPALYIAEAKKRSRLATLPDMDGHYPKCASDEERKIADLLAKNGILFRHEERYEKNVADINHRQYYPDFSIYFYDSTGWHRLYLEHFGIGINGTVSKRFSDGTEVGWFNANKRYLEGIEWKRKIHKENKTVLIETSSADFQRNNIEEVLIDQLRRYGVPIRPLTDEQLYSAMTQNNKKRSEAVSKLITTFITLMKGKCTSIHDVLESIDPASPYFYRDRDIINHIISPYLTEYNKVLKERNEIDFTDAILQAAECCKEGCPHRFEYILIDEFQDISIDRYRLIQALRTNNPLTKLFCVGDDWQSIYRFSGSDMALFQQFSDYFGFTDECRLENTFRFFEPMISKSSTFIMKNPLQRHKDVTNPLPGTTDMKCVAYGNDDEVPYTVANIIDEIPEGKSIAVLGRYSFEINMLVSNLFKIEQAQDYQHIIYKDRVIDFMTVHKSKGLEADYVILLSCNSGSYGFPSTISDDHVLTHVLSASDQYEFGEERRLFYVAITRSKKKTWILYQTRNPSVFIEEFSQPNIEEKDRCPICGAAKKLVKEGTAKNGTPYKYYICSNNEVGCRYSHTEFMN